MATTNRDFRVKNGLVVEGTTATVNNINVVTESASQTLTNKTITTPTLTLSSTSSTASGRVAFDATTDKIIVGDGTNAVEFAPSTILINTQTGTTYTIALSDKDKMVEINNSSAITLYVPTDVSANFPIGSQVNILQTGSGQITVEATTPATTTVNATPGSKFRAQWSAATLIKRAANTWVLIGDLSA